MVAEKHSELPEASIAAESPVLLKANGLKIAFGGHVILDDVDLELQTGQVVLLRGENGSGKTTLLNILTGNLEPDTGTIHYLADGSPRTYCFPRRWWQELNPFDHFAPEFVVREGIGRTWQDVRLFGSLSLRDNIAVAEPGHPGENPILALISRSQSIRREEIINREADAMLARFGLAGREDSSANKISLGQSKRIAIARAVAAGAKILFLDEPLSGLDRQGITEVLSLLEALVRNKRLTLIIVEHIFNHPHLHGLVTTNWLLEKGKITLNDCVATPQENKCSSDESNLKRPEWFHLLASPDAEIIDEPLPRGALLTRIRRPGRSHKFTHPILEIRGLVVDRGRRTVIGLDNHGNQEGFELTIYEGEIAILQAPNGWGKSTLVAAICGYINSSQGEFTLNQKQLDTLPTWSRVRNGLKAVPSENHFFPGLCGDEVLALAGGAAAVAELGAIGNRRCSSLSGGETKKISLIAAIASSRECKVMLLDEPFAALDGEASSSIASRLIENRSVTYLITSPKESDYLPSQFTESHNHTIPLHTQDILNDLKLRSDAGPYSEILPLYSAHFLNVSLEIQPLVTPLLPSSHSFLKYMAEAVLEGKRILDFGCGSGVLAVAVSLLGAKEVDAFDNLPEAVACTAANIQTSGVQSLVNVFESDGFLSVSERYDLIFANLPLVNVERKPVNHHFGLIDPEFSLHRHFLENYRNHLLPGGSAIICHAPLQAEWSFEQFEAFLGNNGAHYQVVFEFYMNDLPWRLYSLT